MRQDEKKRQVALAALEHVTDGTIIGVGTGSTANHFIDGLGLDPHRIRGAVASSEATADRLQSRGIPVLDLDDAGPLDLYVDGADEATSRGELIKGGGGALTREKIVAAASRRFVCIVDDSKLVGKLGAFPLPIEVLPMATGLVTRRLADLGGRGEPRAGFTTDNGNVILDVHGLELSDPCAVESELDHLAGVVANGLFCRRPADMLLVGGDDGVRTVRPDA